MRTAQAIDHRGFSRHQAQKKRTHTAFIGGLVFAAGLCTSACEIVYDDAPDSSESVPEFRLQGARVTRYEESRLSAELTAEVVEQYKRNNTIYGQNVRFRMYEDGKEIGRGECGLIMADNDNDTYMLFDGITFENTRDSFLLAADSLRWTSKEGVLASGSGSQVSVTKNRVKGDEGDDSTFTLTGTDFSADAHQRGFSFDGPVAGRFVTGADMGTLGIPSLDFGGLADFTGITGLGKDSGAGGSAGSAADEEDTADTAFGAADTEGLPGAESGNAEETGGP